MAKGEIKISLDGESKQLIQDLLVKANEIAEMGRKPRVMIPANALDENGEVFDGVDQPVRYGWGYIDPDDARALVRWAGDRLRRDSCIGEDAERALQFLGASANDLFVIDATGLAGRRPREVGTVPGAHFGQNNNVVLEIGTNQLPTPPEGWKWYVGGWMGPTPQRPFPDLVPAKEPNDLPEFDEAEMTVIKDALEYVWKKAAESDGEEEGPSVPYMTALHGAKDKITAYWQRKFGA